ncbi:MAG: ISL3 family transposase [Ktedonobacteraceae bacterium]
MVVERMNVKSLFDLPEELEVISGDVTEKVITITVVSTQRAPCCPLCGTNASRIHSHYSRQLMDMPCVGQRVSLILHVRKFFCDETTCARKIFTERLVPFVRPWARVTTRFFQAVESIGFATSGMLGVRLGDRLGMPASWMTIIRRMMARPSAPVERVIELGIDDFSFRRGRKFGTILVDMQTHKVIDLLPDRKTETASAWMRAHPEISLVSRDRGGDYASAAATGAPQAMQSADRFHILKNLREPVEGLLARHLAANRQKKTQEIRTELLPVWREVRSPKLSPKIERLQQSRREERLARYQQVIALRKQGMSYQAIALRVAMGASTVQSWLAAGKFPDRKPREQASRLDRYLPYLRERWENGTHNMSSLFRELVELGYEGSYESVRDTMIRLLPQGRKKPLETSSVKTPILPTSREASFLFLLRPEKLKTEEQETLTQLRHLHPEVNLAYELVQQFAQMLRTRTGEKLDDWLAQVSTSQIQDFQSFVLGVERDKAAVVAGLTLPQNNGLVEGKVNKLKLIKRMGYGRAEFPLLRQRVLHAI